MKHEEKRALGLVCELLFLGNHFRKSGAGGVKKWEIESGKSKINTLTAKIAGRKG